jgi:uncharacterized protein YutE (UPF0331/DUF86 family)
VLRARFSKLERCIAKVRAALEDLDEEAYLQDTFLQDVVERNLQLASQIVLDVSTHVIAEQGWQSPDSYEEAIQILARHDVIPASLAGQLKGMAGFRNILVHEYLEIDEHQVYLAATDHLEDYELFAQHLAAWAAQDQKTN